MNFDVVMPLFLFSVPLAAIFLAGRAESKLKATVEQKEFGNRDIALFVALIASVSVVIAFVPSYTILVLFLFSYSSLLYTVSYTYSDLNLRNTWGYCVTFIVASVLAAVAGFSGAIPADLRVYGISAFAVLAGCSLFVLAYSLRQVEVKQRWYVAGLSPVLFVLLFAFYSQTGLWFPFLLDVYATLFALLIIIYLAPLFNWKIIFVYALGITALDIFSVWGLRMSCTRLPLPLQA